MPLQTGVAGLAIQLSLSLLVLAGNPGDDVARAIPVLVTASLFYMIGCWTVPRPGRAERWGLMLILGFALEFRRTWLGTSPEFAGDIYRYRWAGRVQIQGACPTRSGPATRAGRRCGTGHPLRIRAATGTERAGHGRGRGAARVVEVAGGSLRSWRERGSDGAAEPARVAQGEGRDLRLVPATALEFWHSGAMTRCCCWRW